MTLTTEQKMMILVLYAMGSSTGGFKEFCKAINGYNEEEIEASFTAMELGALEDMVACVDVVGGEISSLLEAFYIAFETRRHKEQDNE